MAFLLLSPPKVSEETHEALNQLAELLVDDFIEKMRCKNDIRKTD